MEGLQERFILSLEKAKQQIQLADHLVYMTFPIVRENKLLLKALDIIRDSLINAITAILQYEYVYKRIQIYKDAKENFKTFKKLAGKYSINEEQLCKIIEILNLAEKHRKSSFEFSRKNKIVIMSDDARIETISIEKIKKFLLDAKELIKKAGIIRNR